MAYVYRHIRLDKNEPFYIGISKNDDNYRRANSSDRRHRNAIWTKIFNKTPIEVEILIDSIDYAHAKEKEIEFINLYKRYEDGGTLANLTLGGDGVLGFKNPKLAERNRQGIWKGKKHTEETKARMSQNNIGKDFSDTHKRKISQYAKTRTGKRNSNYRGAIYVYKDNVLIGTYDDLKSTANSMGLCQSRISSVLSGAKVDPSGYLFTRIFKGLFAA